MSTTENSRLKDTWSHLLGIALSYGLPLADAEDLVSETLIKALDHFEPERGAFPVFCRTILRNNLKNYWRDRKLHLELHPDSLSDTDPAALNRYDHAHVAYVLECISGELTEDEREFLMMLGNVLQEMESRAVSEAARRLGLPTSKGWDIFRRIQRKARKHRAAFLAEEGVSAVTEQPTMPADLAPEMTALSLDRSLEEKEPSTEGLRFSLIRGKFPAPSQTPGKVALDSTMKSIALQFSRDEAFVRFESSLTGAQRDRLAALSG